MKVTNPFIKNPDCLLNNRSVVVSMAQKLEDRLVMKAWLELIKETVLSDSLLFPRTTRPAQAI